MQEVPFSRPSIGEEEIEAVGAVLRSGWLTTGPETLAFEREFAHYVGAKHALAVNSATAGLHLALEGIGVGPGSVVIVPSLTFTATAEVVRYLGAEVVFADVDRDRLLLDPADVDRRALEVQRSGARLAAVIPVHLAGAVCPMDELRTVADRYDAFMIEDAAHAFPATDTTNPRRYAGTLGEAGVFSFYANKTITTGEGGMVCTENDTLAARIRTMRTHGIDRESWDRYRSLNGGWYYQVIAPGYKYNMPDISAAIGRVQLRRARDLREARRACAEYYQEILSDLEQESLVHLPLHQVGHAWHLYIIRLPERFDRDRVIAKMKAAGVGASVHYIPLHRMPYWSQRYNVTDDQLPNTIAAADHLVSLPLYPDLGKDQQEHVATVLNSILREER